MSDTSDPAGQNTRPRPSQEMPGAPGTVGLFTGLDWRGLLLTGTIGLLLANAVALGLGFVAKLLQHSVDDPMYDRVQSAGHTPWTDVLEVATQLGNVPETQLWTALLAVGLAGWFALRRWRWWVPLVALPVVWVVERGFQFLLAKLVDRDRDALSLLGTPIGAYPSGGVARIIVVAGTAALLAIHYARLSRRTATLLLGASVTLGLAESYFRMRLNQHWLTDVVGGLVYGVMLLVVVATTLRAFDRDPQRRGVSR